MVDRPSRRDGRCAVVPAARGPPGALPGLEEACPPTAAAPAGGTASLLLDVGDDVLDRLEVLELVVGDLHAELVLRGDGDLDHRQRVDVEVVHEALLRGDLGRGDTGDLVDDLGETVQDLLLRVSHVRFLLTFCAAVRRVRPTASVCCERNRARRQGRRSTCAAYVRPAPKPRVSTVLPEGSSPRPIMRDSASGMEADEVFPAVTISRAMSA